MPHPSRRKRVACYWLVTLSGLRQDTVPYQEIARWPKSRYYEIKKKNGASDSNCTQRFCWPKQRDCNVVEAGASFEAGQKAWDSFLGAAAGAALPMAALDSPAQDWGEKLKTPELKTHNQSKPCRV